MPGVYFHKLLDFSQRLLLCPLTVTVDAWSLFWSTPGLFPNIYCYVPWQSQLMPGVYFDKLLDFFPTSTAMSLDSHSSCLEFIFINSWTFPNVYCYVPWQSQLMPGVYFHKLLDFFPMSTAVYFHMSLDSHSWCLEFIFINSWTFSQRLLLCPLTVTVDAWSLFS